MRRGHEVMSGPDFEHISEVYDKAAGTRLRFDPLSVSQLYFQSTHLILSEDGETAKIRMVSDPLVNPGIWLHGWVGDESQHAMRGGKVTGKRVFLEAETQGQTSDDILPDAAKLRDIGFNCLAEPAAV